MERGNRGKLFNKDKQGHCQVIVFPIIPCIRMPSCKCLRHSMLNFSQGHHLTSSRAISHDCTRLHSGNARVVTIELHCVESRALHWVVCVQHNLIPVDIVTTSALRINQLTSKLINLISDVDLVDLD